VSRLAVPETHAGDWPAQSPFGYRRLFVLLRQQGVPSGINRIYRLYREENRITWHFITYSLIRTSDVTFRPVAFPEITEARSICTSRPIPE
jgi:hypothetical protein